MQKTKFFSHILFSSLAIFAVTGIALNMPHKTQIQTVDSCVSKPVFSPTFIKTYHLRDLTDGFSVLPAKDGGYFLSGDTLTASGMAIPNPFLVKTNSAGTISWSRQFSSKSLPPRDSSTSHEPHVIAQTTDGGVITATDIVDFVDAKYENNLKEVGDILITKINSRGAQLWSIMLGDHSVDRPQKIWALPDGGVMLLARFANTDHEPDAADMEAVVKYSIFINIDKNGKVVSAKKFNWEAVDAERLSGGGYIVLANLAIPKTENALGTEVATSNLPTIIKLGNGLDTEWAKSMEMIPSEINTPTVDANGVLVMGKTAIRIPGGDFRAIQPTPDGGYLAMGFYNLLLTTGLSGGSLGPITSYTPRSFMAVKFDAAGNYRWAKKISTNLVSSISGNDLQMIKTADGKFVVMQDVIRDSAGIAAKYKEASANPAGAAAWAEALATNIELVKIDAEANPIWIKQIGAERDLSGFNIAPTADQGAVVAASMLTAKLHKTISGMEPYKEAALIKIDVNGGVSGCAGAIDHRDAVIEDQSQYLVSQNMQAETATDVALNINKKVAEKVSNAKNTNRNICLYKKSAITPICSNLNSNATGDGLTVPPVTKTWALINYENTQEVAVSGTKNATVNNELLPVLRQVFGDQVKIKDNMESMWLTYIFSRLVTRADVEAVQKKYEALGYKIDDSEGGVLNVSRVGLTLHMTFSITSSTLGKLEALL